jgi:hypothetical protein
MAIGKKTAFVGMRIHEDLLCKIKEMAELEDRTITQQVTHLLKTCIKVKEKAENVQSCPDNLS